MNEEFDLATIHSKFRDELTAVSKFVRTMQDIVMSGDAKKVMGTMLTNFLQALNEVARFIKDKKYTTATIEQFRKPIVDELDKNDKNGEKLLDILKEIILVRQRDRVVRENTIRAVKRLIKIAGKPVTKICYSLKMHIFITFILEREFKSSAVAKER